MSSTPPEVSSTAHDENDMCDLPEDSLDEILNSLGGFGWYQKRLVLLCGICLGACGECFNSFLFIGRPAEPVCPEGASECTPDTVCQHYPHSDLEPWRRMHKYTQEFQLVCDHSYMAALLTSTSVAGFAIGSYAGGIFATRYGRRIIINFTHVLVGLCHVALAMSKSITALFVSRCLVGVFAGAHVVSMFTLCMEFIGTPYRAQAGGVMWIIWALMMSLNPLFAWLVESNAGSSPVTTWRMTALAMSLPTLVTIACLPLVPASPRLLLLQGKKHEVMRLLQQVASTNQVPFNVPVVGHVKQSQASHKQDDSTEIRTMYDLMLCDSLVYDQPLNRVFFLTTYLWLAAVLTYYGLSINISVMSGNVYLNNLFSVLCEIPAYAVTGVSLELIGRKRVMSWTLGLCGISCFAIAVVIAKDLGVAPIIAFAAKIFVSLAFSAEYVWSSELFPTNVRSLAFGSFNTFARCAGIVAPIVAHLSVTITYLPALVFGIVASLGVLVSELLPETRGLPMLERIYWPENQRLV